MNAKIAVYCIIALGPLSGSVWELRGGTNSTSFGISYQVNVNPGQQNIPGDAANDPSVCIAPTNPNHIAVGWRQFDTTNSSFRQAGWAYSTNGGLDWTFPGALVAGEFRSDPVLAADANGWFYYLGITNANTLYCELQRSTNGGKTWQPVASALGGDKEWMAIDTTSGSGRGNIYQVWSPFYNYYNNQTQIFTRSTNGGQNWMTAIGLPHSPYFGTLDVGPGGELYMFGSAIDIVPFVVNRSTNAQIRSVTPIIDQTTRVNLGAQPACGSPISPASCGVHA